MSRNVGFRNKTSVMTSTIKYEALLFTFLYLNDEWDGML